MSEREIEIEIGENWWIALLPVVILVAVGLAVLGKQVTPGAGNVLSPAEWTLMKAEREYDQELGRLRDNAKELAQLLNGYPNPVEAGLTADRIQYETLSGHPALGVQRDVVANASQLVRMWAMGGATRADAEAALEEVVLLLEREH